jgi:hypothetical protein
MIVITTQYIESINNGLAFSASELFGENIALIRPPHKSRAEIAAPVVIANRLIIPDGETCGHNAITIKSSDSDIVALPECHSFAFSAAKAVIRDTIDIYGWEKFLKSKIQFILQRTDVRPQEVHRENFGGWHSHETGRNPIDLTYQFTNRNGTEFCPTQTTDGPFVVAAPSHAITRFGAEIKHRSPTNTTSETFSRTWAAFLVYEKDRPSNHYAVNKVLRKENIDRALEAGRHFNDAGLNIFSKPIPLVETSGRIIEPDLHESIQDQFPNGARYAFHSAVHGITSAKIVRGADNALCLETSNFEGEITRQALPDDRWGIQCALMKSGALPIEPINA